MMGFMTRSSQSARGAHRLDHGDAVIGAIGVRSVVRLTGITLASNLGTSSLWMTSRTIVAYRKRKRP